MDESPDFRIRADVLADIMAVVIVAKAIDKQCPEKMMEAWGQGSVAIDVGLLRQLRKALESC